MLQAEKLAGSEVMHAYAVPAPPVVFPKVSAVSDCVVQEYYLVEKDGSILVLLVCTI